MSATQWKRLVIASYKPEFWTKHKDNLVMTTDKKSQGISSPCPLGSMSVCAAFQGMKFKSFQAPSVCTKVVTALL